MTGNCELLVIDMQKYFLDSIPSSQLERLIPAQVALVRKAGKANVQIRYFEWLGHGPTIEPVAEALQESGAKQYKKSYNSCFANKQYLADLRQAGVRSICITGVDALQCLLDSCRHGRQLGYTMVSSASIQGDQTQSGFDLAMREMRLLGVRLVHEARLLDYLMYPSDLLTLQG